MVLEVLGAIWHFIEVASIYILLLVVWGQRQEIKKLREQLKDPRYTNINTFIEEAKSDGPIRVQNNDQGE